MLDESTTLSFATALIIYVRCQTENHYFDISILTSEFSSIHSTPCSLTHPKNQSELEALAEEIGVQLL